MAFGVLGDVTWSIKKKIIKDQQKPSNHPNKTGSLLVYSTCQACDSKKKPSQKQVTSWRDMDEEGQASFGSPPGRAGFSMAAGPGPVGAHQVADEPGGDPPNVSWLESEILKSS